MKKYHITLFLLFLSYYLYANGGGVKVSHSVSPIKGVSRVQLLTESDFELIRENLSLHINKNFVSVQAVYQIQNKGHHQKNIQYGFAIDYRNKDKKDLIKSYHIDDKLNTLDHYTVDEFNISYDKKIGKEAYGKDLNLSDSISRRWYISEINFKPQQTKIITVEYDIQSTYYFRDMWYGSSEPCSDELGGDNRESSFYYFLKPSGFWGNGIVKDFNVNISFDNHLTHSLKSYKGLPLTKLADNLYNFHKKNFNLLEKEALILEYSYSDEVPTGLDFLKSFQNKDIVKYATTSIKEHPKYPLSHLFDGDPKTTFVYRKSNQLEGDWIKFDFDTTNDIKVRDIDPIFIINGYTKSQLTYDNNNIVTELKIEIEWSRKGQLEKKVEICKLERDSNAVQNLYRKADEQESAIDYLISNGDYNLPCDEVYYINKHDNIFITSIKIIFLNNDKGIKYDDTCISELCLVYGKL